MLDGAGEQPISGRHVRSGPADSRLPVCGLTLCVSVTWSEVDCDNTESKSSQFTSNRNGPEEPRERRASGEERNGRQRSRGESETGRGDGAESPRAGATPDEDAAGKDAKEREGLTGSGNKIILGGRGLGAGRAEQSRGFDEDEPTSAAAGARAAEEEPSRGGVPEAGGYSAGKTGREVAMACLRQQVVNLAWCFERCPL